MNRAQFSFLTAVAVGALALTACGVGGSPADRVTTITIVAADYGGSNGQDSSKAYWDSVIAAFEKTSPEIRVEVRVIGWNSINDALSTMVRNRNYPDIIEGPAFANWATAGLLYPAQAVLTPGTEADILPSLLAGGKVNDTQYLVPFVSSSRAFLIDNTLWRKARLPMAGGKALAPRTWADVTADARKLRAAGVAVPLGLPLGPEEAQDETLMWEMNTPGGGYADSHGKWTLNSASNVQTLTQLARWVHAGLTERDPAAVNRTALYKDFAAGKVGMLNGMPIQLSDVASGKLDVTWSPLPTAEADEVPATLGVADWISAFKAGGHASQIRTFLNFVYQEPNQVAFDEEYDLLPVTVDAIAKVRSDAPDLKPFLDALPSAQFVPANNAGWATVLKQLQSRIGDALKDPEKGLDSLQEVAFQASQ
jgi:multiple sugar transport system substrate-binding protein